MVDTPRINQSRLEDLVEKYQYFIFDCDGVLFHSGDEIGQAFSALKYIKKHPSKNKDVFFFTNATTRTREELLKKVQTEHNYYDIPKENMYTASYLTARYCKDKLIPAMKAEKPTLFSKVEPSVFVIGEKGFKSELRNFGVRVINQEAEVYPQKTATNEYDFLEMAKKVDPSVVAVIVGTDFKLSSNKMALASLYINQNNAELIGTNIDRNDGFDRLRPSGGSLV